MLPKKKVFVKLFLVHLILNKKYNNSLVENCIFAISILSMRKYPILIRRLIRGNILTPP